MYVEHRAPSFHVLATIPLEIRKMRDSENPGMPFRSTKYQEFENTFLKTEATNCMAVVRIIGKNPANGSKD